MKDNTRRVYDQPLTEMISVEVEGGIFTISPTGGDINDPGQGPYYEFEL